MLCSYTSLCPTIGVGTFGYIGLYIAMLCFHCPYVLSLKSTLVSCAVFPLFALIVIALAKWIAATCVIKAPFSFSYNVGSRLFSL
jgi:hypothetical protein